MTLGHVLIVGAHWVLREGVKQTLKRLGLVIAGEGDDLENAWNSRPGATTPDVVLVIDGQTGHFGTALEAACEARRTFADAKVAIWSDTSLPEDVSAAIRAGADALLSSTLSSRLLGNSLQLVLLGHKLFPTLPAQETHEGSAAASEPAPLPPPPPAPLPDLDEQPPAATSRVVRLEDHVPSSRLLDPPTSLVWNDGRPKLGAAANSAVPSDREWEILRCLSSGKSNKVIARELSIAETTVKVHIKSLLRKLSVSNRTQAAIWALNQGGSTASVARPLLMPTQLHSK